MFILEFWQGLVVVLQDGGVPTVTKKCLLDSVSFLPGLQILHQGQTLGSRPLQSYFLLGECLPYCVLGFSFALLLFGYNEIILL